MTNIYILKLEQNKYYIGKTNNVDTRINDHNNGNGSQWTRKYKPIKIIEIIPDCDDFDEDKYTKIYMNKFGIHNVRGGSYTKSSLSKEEINLLEKEIMGSTDKCYICNNLGHFSKKCPEEKVENNSVFSTFSNIVSEFIKVDKNVCYRCGRDTHFAGECYAKTTKYGQEIKDTFCCSYCDKEFDTLKGATCHENLYCKSKSKTCYKCGRDGHISTNCYARTFIKN